MSDFKRWTDEDSDASAAERDLLAAGSTKELALGAERKAELRRALAIAIALPLPPDGGPSDGSTGGPPPPPAPPPPPVPPPIAETAGVLGSVGKLVFSGKASGALVAFVLAAGGTAGVLGVATLTNERPSAPSVAAASAPVVKTVDEPPALGTPTALPAAAAAVVTPSALPSEPAAASVARPARSFGEKPLAGIEAPPLPAAPAPTEATANAPVVLAPTPAPPSAAVLVIPAAPDVRLADEIARVRAARDALRSGNAGLALSLLDAIDREHPAGTLGQEREAMRIEALANTGRTTEARARADAFLARHRGSAFASSVSRFATP